MALRSTASIAFLLFVHFGCSMGERWIFMPFLHIKQRTSEKSYFLVRCLKNHAQSMLCAKSAAGIYAPAYRAKHLCLFNSVKIFLLEGIWFVMLCHCCTGGNRLPDYIPAPSGRHSFPAAHNKHLPNFLFPCHCTHHFQCFFVSVAAWVSGRTVLGTFFVIGKGSSSVTTMESHSIF